MLFGMLIDTAIKLLDSHSKKMGVIPYFAREESGEA